MPIGKIAFSQCAVNQSQGVPFGFTKPARPHN